MTPCLSCNVPIKGFLGSENEGQFVHVKDEIRTPRQEIKTNCVVTYQIFLNGYPAQLPCSLLLVATDEPIVFQQSVVLYLPKLACDSKTGEDRTDFCVRCKRHTTAMLSGMNTHLLVFTEIHQTS